MTTLRTELDVRSEAGSLKGRIAADVLAPGRSVKGELQASNVDASRAVAKLPPTRVNGHATFDVALNDDQTIRGTTKVKLENTVAAGYVVDGLDANAQLAGNRATLDARAVAPTGHARRRKARCCCRLPAARRWPTT